VVFVNINCHYRFLYKLIRQKEKPKQKFNYTGMPHIKPLPIKTKGKGFWKAIVMWLLSTRNWELTARLEIQYRWY